MTFLMWRHTLTLTDLSVKFCRFPYIDQPLFKIANISVLINNEPLESIPTAKYIGMHMDENLRWNKYITIMNSKISDKISILICLRNTILINTMEFMCNTIILPHIDYTNKVNGTSCETDNSSLNRLSCC